MFPSPTLTRRVISSQLKSQFRPHTSARNFATSRPHASRLRQPGEPTGPNEPPSHISSPRSKSPLKVWPIVGIFVLGSYLFKKIVDQQKEQAAYKPTGPVVGYSSVSPAPSGRNIKPSHPH